MSNKLFAMNYMIWLILFVLEFNVLCNENSWQSVEVGRETREEEEEEEGIKEIAGYEYRIGNHIRIIRRVRVKLESNPVCITGTVCERFVENERETALLVRMLGQLIPIWRVYTVFHYTLINNKRLLTLLLQYMDKSSELDLNLLSLGRSLFGLGEICRPGLAACASGNQFMSG